MEDRLELLYKIFWAKSKMWAGLDESCKFAYQNAAAIVLDAMDGNDENLREIYAMSVKEEEEEED